MKQGLLIPAILILAAAGLSAGAAAEELDSQGWRHYPRLQEFSGVDVRMNAEVVLQPGDLWEVKVRGDERVLKDMDLYVNGGRLVIRRQSLFDFMDSGNQPKVMITLPRLNRVALSSSGSIRTRESFETTDLELEISGSGELVVEAMADAVECVSSGSGHFEYRGRSDVFSYRGSGSGDGELELRSNKLELVLTGSGDLDMRGGTDVMELKISGSGDVRGDRMTAENVEVTISGSGDAEIYSEADLEVRISGSGSVIYSGNPQHTDFRSSGSGKISSSN